MATAAYSFPTRSFEILRSQNTRSGKDLRDNVEQALDQGDRHLVFDCGDWNELDVITLASLIRCTAACRDRGASFEVANISKEMRENVRQLGLVDRLDLRN